MAAVSQIRRFASPLAQREFSPTLANYIGIDTVAIFVSVPVPDPGTLARLGLAIALAGAVARRRKPF